MNLARFSAVVFVSASLHAACTGGPASTEPSTIEAAEPAVRVSPRIGGRGMTYVIRLRGTNTAWTDGTVSLDLGADIAVAGVTVLGPNTADADVSIPEGAALGYRDMTVGWVNGDGDPVTKTFTGDDGFLVESGGIAVTPGRARLGETMTLDVVGTNTSFQDGSTWADLGDGVFVNWLEVDDSTHARVSISVDQRADPGLHDIVLFNGPTGWTLQEGLFIDRTSIAIEIDPNVGNQGETLYFTVSGWNTHWVEAGNRKTFIDLGPNICVEETWPDCQDPVRPGGEVSVQSPTLVNGRMDISNGAQPGFYDVRAYVMEEQDLDGNFIIEPDEYIVIEEVILHDGFEVREVPIDCNDVPGVSFGFNIGRQFDNDSCEINEGVSASAVFYTPLDPPCGNIPPMPPPPFDVDGVIQPPPAPDCPTPRTCDAGPYVYFESEVNTITLERNVNSFTGDIYYVPAGALTLADYPFGYVAYDMRAEGSDDPSQIPAFVAEDVLYTLPSDFELLAPILCQNYTHNTADPLQIRWTPAQTYDVAGLGANLSTVDENDQANVLMVFPWDDGEYDWSAEALQAIPPGGGQFSFGAGVGEPKWFLDFGNGPVGLENQGSSGLSYSGIIILEAPPEEPAP